MICTEKKQNFFTNPRPRNEDNPKQKQKQNIHPNSASRRSAHFCTEKQKHNHTHTHTLNQNRHHAVSTHGEQRKVKFVVDGDVIQWKQSVIQVSFFFMKIILFCALMSWYFYRRRRELTLNIMCDRAVKCVQFYK